MSTVVNSESILALFTQLGWTTSQRDLLTAALSSGIPAVDIYAYLSALAASPSGLDDSTITGCPATVAAQITAFLKNKGLVGV